MLARAKFRRWFTGEEAERFVGDLRRIADEVTDPPAARAQRVQDPDDELLVALVGVAQVEALVSGDAHLLGLEDIGALSSPRRSSFGGCAPGPDRWWRWRSKRARQELPGQACHGRGHNDKSQVVGDDLSGAEAGDGEKAPRLRDAGRPTSRRTGWAPWSSRHSTCRRLRKTGLPRPFRRHLAGPNGPVPLPKAKVPLSRGQSCASPLGRPG